MSKSSDRPPASGRLRLVVSNKFVVVGEGQPPALSILQGDRNDENSEPPPAVAQIIPLPSPAVKACADRLVASYHNEQPLQPGRLCLRVECSGIAADLLEAAVFELERRGWTITSADFPDNDIRQAKALWLRPYC